MANPVADASGGVEDRAHYALDGDLDDDAAGVGAGFAVAGGVATLALADVGRLARHAGRALEGEPATTVDLAHHRIPPALDVEGLLGALEGDDAGEARLAVPREPDGDDVRRAVLAEGRERREVVLGQELECLRAYRVGGACHATSLPTLSAPDTARPTN